MATARHDQLRMIPYPHPACLCVNRIPQPSAHTRETVILLYNRAFPEGRNHAMNSALDRLQPYPFERLGELLAATAPPSGVTPISLAMGEPSHPPPEHVRQTLVEHIDGIGKYPATRGSDALRQTIADWLQQRFGTDDLDPEHHVLPVNGTREALFAIAQAVVDPAQTDACVVMPNPCYQIYEGAAILAGAEPVYYSAAELDEPMIATLPESVWSRCQLLYLCNPGNPTGSLLSMRTQRWLIRLAREHDFVIAADECYSEIHDNDADPPCGLLQAARGDFRNCLVFHSLSKRSHLPGLRSGFVAGDPDLIAAFTRYRTYHGCAMAPPTQAASIAAWRDEDHVRDNRAAYRDKFTSALDELADVLPVERPAAGFYLWPRVPGGDDEQFCRELFAATGVKVLPGQYLGRAMDGDNPAAGRVRMALVAERGYCLEAMSRLRSFLLAGG